MRLEIRGIGVGEIATPALPRVDALLTDEAPAVVGIASDRGPMLASLIIGGRLAADRGDVLLDDDPDPEPRRRAIALVDTPVVAEPAPDVSVGAAVREELLFAARPTNRAAVHAVLDELDLERWAGAPMADLPPADRIRLLAELAAARPGVRALVLTSPERHGGSPADWRRVADDLTARGTPVLVIGGGALAATPLLLPPAADGTEGTPR